MRVAIFPTCLVDAVSPEVGLAAVRVLRRAGHEVTLLTGATCCGQPGWNAGQARAAAPVARRTLQACSRADVDVVVVPAGSCVTMMRVFWPEMFEVAGDHRSAALAREIAGRVREFSEFLRETNYASELTTERGDQVVYHRSCHMLRELGIVDQPERLLDATGTKRIASAAEGRCCGFGGLFSVKLPETATAMADDVLDAARMAGADEIVGCDSSCLMHLRGRAERRALPLRFRHLAEVLDDPTTEGDR